MIGRVVEVSGSKRHLALLRGFMTVHSDGDEIARIPLDDIGVLIANAHGLTYTNALLVALAERGVGVVICGHNYAPVSWLWPVEGNHVQARRMRLQIQATKPLQKRLWQRLIQKKISLQAAAMRLRGLESTPVEALIGKVRSGDPENIEAQSSRRYWGPMFGADFRRDRSLGGPNELLNYGYTVLRSATARAVVAAGLHPSLGIHHRRATNSMCLIDDLMEPFRPFVDLLTARLLDQGVASLTRTAKEELAGLTTTDARTSKGRTPVVTCLERAATSLAQSYESRCVALELPDAPILATISD
jgi:CRISPR-associated protein Cas1